MKKHGLFLECHDGICSMTAAKSSFFELACNSTRAHWVSLVHRCTAWLAFILKFISLFRSRVNFTNVTPQMMKKNSGYSFINSRGYKLNAMNEQRRSDVSNTSNSYKSNDASEAVCKKKNQKSWFLSVECSLKKKTNKQTEMSRLEPF